VNTRARVAGAWMPCTCVMYNSRKRPSVHQSEHHHQLIHASMYMRVRKHRHRTHAFMYAFVWGKVRKLRHQNHASMCTCLWEKTLDTTVSICRHQFHWRFTFTINSGYRMHVIDSTQNWISIVCYSHVVGQQTTFYFLKRGTKIYLIPQIYINSWCCLLTMI
jgi:hypothetical protein